MATFLSLSPAERAIIYELLLPEDQTISATAAFPAILQACPTTRNEATPIWRSRNTFTIQYSNPRASVVPAPTFANGAHILQRTGLALIRHLRITDDMEDQERWYSCECGGAHHLTIQLDVHNAAEYSIRVFVDQTCGTVAPAINPVTPALAKAKAWVAAVEHFMGGAGTGQGIKLVESKVPELVRHPRLWMRSETPIGAADLPFKARQPMLAQDRGAELKAELTAASKKLSGHKFYNKGELTGVVRERRQELERALVKAKKELAVWEKKAER